MTAPQTYSLTLPGPMLKRGFWLYVWRVKSPKGEVLYVGRTGDNSSPHATAPYTRMGQHLGFAKNQNSLRRLLSERGIVPEHCETFELVAHGPIYGEIEKAKGQHHDELMKLHTPFRNLVGAMERELASALRQAGYEVLNSVSWKHPHDVASWAEVRAAFAEHFPRLAQAATA